MKDIHAFRHTEITASATKYVAVINDDDISGDFENVTTGIYVGVGGNVSVADINNVETIFVNVPSGFILPVRARRINDTNTSAGSLVAMW